MANPGTKDLDLKNVRSKSQFAAQNTTTTCVPSLFCPRSRKNVRSLGGHSEKNIRRKRNVGSLAKKNVRSLEAFSVPGAEQNVRCCCLQEHTHREESEWKTTLKLLELPLAIYIYIYIHIERERYRDREREI